MKTNQKNWPSAETRKPAIPSPTSSPSQSQSMFAASFAGGGGCYGHLWRDQRMQMYGISVEWCHPQRNSAVFGLVIYWPLFYPMLIILWMKKILHQLEWQKSLELKGIVELIYQIRCLKGGFLWEVSCISGFCRWTLCILICVSWSILGDAPTGTPCGRSAATLAIRE